MSIISDALKKAENTRRITTEDLKPKPQTEPNPLQQDLPGNKAARAHEQVGLALILVIALAAGWYLLSRKSAKTVPTGQGPQFEAQKKVEAVPNVPYEGVIYKSENEPPPPAKPLPPEPSAPPILTLNGIMYSAQMRYAIINNGMFQEGDSVNGATVVRIDKDQVLFNYNGADFKLTLKK